MRPLLDTAGERISFDCRLPWVAEMIAEGAGGELRTHGAPAEPSLQVVVEKSVQPFDVAGLRLLTREAYAGEAEVVIENVCSSGFDVRVRCGADGPELAFRWRPPRRERAASLVLRARFRLLARAVLMQYPALWWAGTRGRVPLHVSGCRTAGAGALVVSAGGVGRSTLLLREIAAGGVATGDNIAVGDGTSVWGLVEPVRATGVGGRRTTHGRGEAPLRERLRSLAPDRIVVLERGDSAQAELEPCDPVVAARALAASTYMAGELGRYWRFAATLAAGTGVGPTHPPVADVAAAFVSRLPCYRLRLGTADRVRLADLLKAEAVAA